MDEEELQIVSNNIRKFDDYIQNGGNSGDIGFENIREKFGIFINTPVSGIISNFCKNTSGMTQDAKKLVHKNNVFVISIKFSLYKLPKNLNSVEFNITLNNDKLIVRDNYPKIVTGKDVLRDYKLGINEATLKFEKISEGKNLICEYSELHPTIKCYPKEPEIVRVDNKESLENEKIFQPVIAWKYINEDLEGEKSIHIILAVPKNQNETEVKAKFTLEYENIKFSDPNGYVSLIKAEGLNS
ncbi:hypothetical protein [Methanosarcina acetivorans]|uniref:Uncharacterized protein n=1 Tax=Methanosarcina acetivorans (strain ATCC 35395 / DSM 2834 / JCM 12185 / C2A) TaxID=188937 RepID=Q8TP89_METAC|nr:hypothetical protein [Methanosarcina acetivorans]AAM05428.1 predicted protein [Methanosarcina acetivorans C2A]